MRHILKVSAVALVAVGLMAGPAGAATPINGTGTVHCTIAGTIKIKPPLISGGTTPSVISIKVKETGCTGTVNGASITGGSTSGSETTTNNNCTSIVGPASHILTAVTKWKSSVKLNSTTSKFTMETGNTGTPLSYDVAGSNTAGSFTGRPSSAHAVIQETLAQILTACGGKGEKELHIVGASTITSS